MSWSRCSGSSTSSSAGTSEAAAALHEIEGLQREVDETRARGAAIAAFLAGVPGALAAREAEERAAARVA